MRTRKINTLLADMSVFVQVADHGSFAAAARVLGMTPSALSRQVSRLEDALSNKLLERTTRRLCLTEFGIEAYAACRRMIDSATEVVDLAQMSRSTPHGVLRVSAPKAFGKQVIHPLMSDFLKLYPLVNVQLIITDRLVDWVSDQLDLIITITDQPRAGYVSHQLLEVKQCLCASQAYLDAHGTPLHPDDLLKHQCITLGELSEDNRWLFSQGDEHVQVLGSGRYSVNHTEARLDSVMRGDGIAAFPDFTAQAAIDDGRVVQLLKDWNLGAAYRGFAYIQHPQTKYVTAKTSLFIEFLTRHFRGENNAVIVGGKETD